MRVGQLLPVWLDVPDLAAVFGNGAVRTELARGGDIHDGHLGPFSGVLKRVGKLRRVTLLM